MLNLKLKNFCLFACLFFLSFKIYSQSIMIGDKQYKSTKSFRFEYAESYMSGPLFIKVARDKKNGFIWLETDLHNNVYHFKGKIIIYLENGLTIKCIDRGIKDSYNGKIIAVYKLTFKEMVSLCESDITTVRFSVGDKWNNMTYLAKNKYYEKKSDGWIIEKIEMFENTTSYICNLLEKE